MLHISSSNVGCAGAKGFWIVGRDMVGFVWCGAILVRSVCVAGPRLLLLNIQNGCCSQLLRQASISQRSNAVRGVRSQPKTVASDRKQLSASFVGVLCSLQRAQLASCKTLAPSTLEHPSQRIAAPFAPFSLRGSDNCSYLSAQLKDPAIGSPEPSKQAHPSCVQHTLRAQRTSAKERL